MLALPSKSRLCLVCSFRTGLPPTSRSRPSCHELRRRYTASPPVLGQLHSYPFRRRRPANTLASSKSILSPDQVAKRTLNDGLPRLKGLLETRKAAKDSDLTLLKSLDPTGLGWTSFAERLKGILKDPEDVTSKDSILLGKIGGLASGADWVDDLVYGLHHAFIDHVLEHDYHKTGTDTDHTTTTDLRFPTEWYSGARQIQREVHLHVGPTNSGKTYNALKRLEEKASGFYAGPLRLLAHEVYSRFKAKGVPCDLVTGDDVRLDDNEEVSISASTVEMVDTARSVQVAVIDEIQMIESADRGWAWTRAFLGANAAEVHLCGENRVIPLIRELTASMGDTLHIHEYKRLNALKVMSRSLDGDFKNLKKGDCMVSFSIVTLHALKKQIEVDTGRRCAIVYGGLPPETRAQQAALFNDPDNEYDFLVASDAIGMGLNLSVKRIIFHSVTKFNGRHIEQLTVPQIKQIAGRAGRYRSAHQAMKAGESKTSTSASVGLVTTLNATDLHVIKEAIGEEAPPVRKAGILPPGEVLEEVSTRMPKGVPFEYILKRVCSAAEMHPRFSVCNISEQSSLSRVIENVEGLTIPQRLTLTAAPAASNSKQLLVVLKALATAVGKRQEITIVDVPEIELEVLEEPVTGDRAYLEKLENLHKSLIIFLWLSYRFINNFKDRDMATYAKELTEEKINTCLLEFSANPLLRKKALTSKRQIFHGTTTEGPEGADDLNLSGLDDSAPPIDWSKVPEPQAMVRRVAAAA
ncbi:uncharacterized protein A1O9_10397 [Exophiala aquamarina CBS 119918]|uniref:ATP-dependent RNA helicase SUV3, mitochondrial n=1 Tax=Exophiala aquamarina CBS 119918 TaxID=1182545 RepID=A0A072P172_9EURO|nr:uncharacterized protein A1O9_10397 [Exophiala aquamarina CBS 119918]KEF53422.1 hypothetical protein A1O9_10397 [Exophiala aquamarina CBS 119918]